MAVLLVIGILAITIGSGANVTGAFSQSLNTLSGNSFSPTSIGLDVDKVYASDPNKICKIVLYSGTNDIVQQTGKNATPVRTPYPLVWTANIPGATWIWKSPTVENPMMTQSYTFVREFNWTGPVGDATIEIASDNSYQVMLNGFLLGASLTPNNYAAAKKHNLKLGVMEGKNVLKITVWNLAGTGPNAAGLLYRLNLTKGCCMSCDITCKAIYNFTDVKPGDHGSDVFRFSVQGADAWACLDIHNKEDDENDLIDPEWEAGDITPFKGELSSFMELFGWFDTDQDGKYEPGETMLFQGSLSPSLPIFSISDSAGNYRTPIPAGSTKYIGIFWCCGKITGADSYNLQCDGSSPANNVAQTDILSMDVEFSAFQSANNPGFKC